MENPISKAYQLADGAIMHCVNGAVYAWNWTTGRPKEDLSNLLDDGSAIAVPLSFVISDLPYPVSFLASGGWLLGVHLLQKAHRRTGEIESKANENGYKSAEAESEKNTCEVTGLFYLSCGAGLASRPLIFDNYRASSELCGIGFCLKGAAEYVTRADYLPPRKSAARRAWDWTSEFASEFRNLL